MLPILIVGTGALACLFAAQFAATRIPITMIGTWSEGIAAIRSKGVMFIDQQGTWHNYPVNVVTEPINCGEVRLALVLVKSWQTEFAAKQLRNCLHPQGLALSLQNGLGNHQKLSAILGTDRVAMGVTTTGATLIAPGRVRSGGEGVISLEANDWLRPFYERFRKAGFVIERTSSLESLIWGKLAINAAINPLSALWRVSNGELVCQQSTHRLMALAALEVEAVALARGIQLPFEDVVEALEGVATRTAQNRSSMLQDVLRGAPTEIDAINGEVIKAAKKAGVPVPINRILWCLVKSIVKRNSTRRYKYEDRNHVRRAQNRTSTAQ